MINLFLLTFSLNQEVYNRDRDRDRDKEGSLTPEST